MPKESLVINIASLNDNIFEKSLKHIKSAIDFSSRIGSDLYTFHPGFLKDPNSENKSSDNYDFCWSNNNILKSDYESSWVRMIAAMKEIIKYSEKKNIKVAFETEGSFEKSHLLMMQKPEEFERLKKIFPSSKIGINLNIGHL